VYRVPGVRPRGGQPGPAYGLQRLPFDPSAQPPPVAGAVWDCYVSLVEDPELEVVEMEDHDERVPFVFAMPADRTGPLVDEGEDDISLSDTFRPPLPDICVWGRRGDSHLGRRLQ